MANTTNPESWYARCRLAWLERQAQAAGTINRSDIVTEFGVSMAQASSDLQAYQDLNPGALFYDLPGKTYRWSPKTKLIITPAPWASFPK